MKGQQRLCVTVLVTSVLVSACEADRVDLDSGRSIEELLRREATEIWTKGDLSVIPEIFSENQIAHYGDRAFESTHETMRNTVTRWRTAFPDLEMIVEDVIVNGDKAAARYTVTGTHLGKYGSHDSTGNEFRFEQIYIVRVEGGKVVETWGTWDEYGFKQQLGIIPSQ